MPRARTFVAIAALALTGGAWLATAGAQPVDPPAPPPAAPEQPKAPKVPKAPEAPPKAPKAPEAPPKTPKAPEAPPKAPKAPKAPETPKAPKAPEAKAPAAEDKPGQRQPEAGRPGADVAPPGLPSWHPPVGQPAQPGQRPQLSREQLEEMLRQRRARQEGAGAVRPGMDLPPSTPVRVKAPRDEHGYCVHDGPDDPPREINLFHGWLGVDNEAAEPAPPRFGGEDWWGRNDVFDLGNKEWWAWRLTPHPYRYENHNDHCDRRNQPLPLAASIVNVAVLAFILVRFGRRPVTEALRRRKQAIMGAIDKAQEIKSSAQKRLDRYEDELENLDERLVALREQYALEGEHEERRVRQEAAESRERMLADAIFRISQEHKSARDVLSRQALEEALRAAEAMLERSVTTADHDRLEAEFLDQIDQAFRPRGGVS